MPHTNWIVFSALALAVIQALLVYFEDALDRRRAGRSAKKEGGQEGKDTAEAPRRWRGIRRSRIGLSLAYVVGFICVMLIMRLPAPSFGGFSDADIVASYALADGARYENGFAVSEAGILDDIRVGHPRENRCVRIDSLEEYIDWSLAEEQDQQLGYHEHAQVQLFVRGVVDLSNSDGRCSEGDSPTLGLEIGLFQKVSHPNVVIYDEVGARTLAEGSAPEGGWNYTQIQALEGEPDWFVWLLEIRLRDDHSERNRFSVRIEYLFERSLPRSSIKRTYIVPGDYGESELASFYKRITWPYEISGQLSYLDEGEVDGDARPLFGLDRLPEGLEVSLSSDKKVLLIRTTAPLDRPVGVEYRVRRETASPDDLARLARAIVSR